ncbi:MAG: VOC family protein [Candidatus Omnitrophota bacterium]|jgi:lactoylglutathione lyase|nr:VOC family protein [Candidatus Omnitrophota bacterium]
MVKRFSHSCVLVKNLNRSLRFYGDLLGLKVVKKVTVEGNCPETAYNIKGLKITYVKLRAPCDPKKRDGLVELQCWQRPKTPANKTYNHLSFNVSGLEREYKRLKKRGVKFISQPVITPNGKSKLCSCYDPDNNLIEFIEDLSK